MILVVSNGFNSPKASLQCFENSKRVFEKIDVNIGKNGLGWGIGQIELKQDNKEALKFEGDKKAPIGIFKLSSVFGYEKEMKLHMPYLHASKDLICVDDSDSLFYNKIIEMPKAQPKSFEYMRREDNQYELGIMVAHNEGQIKKRGSCIFIHVQKSKDAPTVGCTSMSLENIKKIVNWLDADKKPVLIQVPKSKLDQITKLYPKLELDDY